jgi:alkanesulfonate monooxygenase SsuD/methylene tetrahydromethanopterin reductase-like flavin-dependent oxidoreductase (luciferase family)
MPNTLRFGIQYDFRNPPQWHRPWADLYAETIEFAAWTESLGFDDVWLTEHHGSEDGYLPSPLIAGTAIATRTKRIRIGSGLSVAPLYHPVRLAEDGALLDIISNGRFQLGLGAGYRAEEFAAYGADFEGRGTVTAETLQIIRRLWDGETVTFDSPHFKLKDARVVPRPVQQRVPLWVGGFVRAAFKRAARYGDGIVVNTNNVVSSYGQYVEELKACGKSAATARVICGMQFCYVSDDPERTWHEIGPHVLHQVNTYAQWLAGSSHAILQPMDLAKLRTGTAVQVLTPDEVIAKIKALVGQVPIEGFYTLMPPAGYPLSLFAKHVELFASKVIPAFSAVRA